DPVGALLFESAGQEGGSLAEEQQGKEEAQEGFLHDGRSVSCVRCDRTCGRTNRYLTMRVNVPSSVSGKPSMFFLAECVVGSHGRRASARRLCSVLKEVPGDGGEEGAARPVGTSRSDPGRAAAGRRLSPPGDAGPGKADPLFLPPRPEPPLQP